MDQSGVTRTKKNDSMKELPLKQEAVGTRSGTLSGIPVLPATMTIRLSTKLPRSVTGNQGMLPATSARNIIPSQLLVCLERYIHRSDHR